MSIVRAPKPVRVFWQATRRGILAGVALAALTGCIAFTLEQTGPEEAPGLSMQMSRGLCIERDDVRFTAAPADPDDLSHIFPYGLMTGSHVTPTDHQYYYWATEDAPVERYAVRSPADGVIVQANFQNGDYRVVIEHSCDLYTIWILIEKLAGPLAHLDGTLSNHKYSYDRVPVRAGEIIGYDGGTPGFDFSLHDGRVLLSGYVRPESYTSEVWKVHTVDPYDYFEEPVRSQLLAKNVRQVEPLGGKIDYDIDGTLMGNWFVEGSNGYAGPADPQPGVGYWSTHLAIAPDPVDPRAIIVSMPDFGDHREQVAIGRLDPHPEDVTPSSGLVKYELVGWAYVRESTGEHWGGITRPFYDDIVVETYPQHVDGVILCQLLADRRLKFEAFPGATASEVEGFTDDARTYER